MIRVRRLAGLSIAVAAVAAIDACHKAPEPAPTPLVQTAGANQDSARLAAEEAARRAAAEAAAKRRADSIAAAEEAAKNAAAAAASLKATLTAMVHFDYDRSEIRSDDRTILDAKLPILESNPGVSLRIAGHTDERGSDEYNLALGQRRAAAVKRYLTEHGIQEMRLETISYGEERPIAQGSDEAAWSQNRRAEFEITAGGTALRKP
jgi:peptidoglycan-associated lipoprotein